MKVIKEKDFEIYSFLDLVKGKNAGTIIDRCVQEIPKIEDKGFAGYSTKEELTNILDLFLLDKDKKHNFFNLENYKAEELEKIKEVMGLLRKYQKSKKYIFVFPSFDNFTVKKMKGVGGFCPKKDIIFIFLNLNGKGWNNALKDSLIHEFAHSVSEYYLGGQDFNLGEGIIFDGLSENFRKINFGGSDILINVISEKESEFYFKELREKFDSKDFDLYMDVFYGTGKYPLWLGYSLGYHLVKKYIENLEEIEWNELLRKDPKEILKEII